jgi:hypothetical protein
MASPFVSSRHGAALIMAIVILAGMLLLGLPFLFSQSASLTGTRSFAHSQIAQVGRTTAEDMGIGAAAINVTRYLQQGGQTETTSFRDGGLGIIPPYDPRRLTFDLSQSGLEWNSANARNAAIIGMSLEDEYGKLNVNHMDVKAWARLFEKVGIADWDDGDDGPSPNDNLDDDVMGQLAYALAAARYDIDICPEGRITRFEQLLEVIPQPPGIRWPLTRAELVQLRPFLTLSTIGAGREGLIDIGTMIRFTPSTGQGGSNQNSNTTLDTLNPSELIGFPVARDLIGAGSVVVSNSKGRQGKAGPQRQQTSKYLYGMATSMDLETIPTGKDGNGIYPPSYSPKDQDAVAIEAPAPLNIHESSEPTRWVLKDLQKPAPGSPATLADLVQLRTGQPDALNLQITGFMLQNPLGVYDVLGSATVEETRTGDPGNGNEMANGKLTENARCIHISASGSTRLNQLPKRGYARIESANADPMETNPEVEFISYNGGLPASGGSATLWNVRRGLSFPGSTGAIEHPAGGATKITIIAPRELPPLAIASQGIVTIESGVSVADAAGKQSAQQFRRVVAQAVPQEQLLESRWEKESEYHALLVQRHGSLMNAFPKAYQRQFDVPPDNNKNLPVNPNNLDQNTGVRPATLRTLLTATHLGTRTSTGRESSRTGREWSRSFSMEEVGDNPLDQGDMEYSAKSSNYSASDLTPEGLTMKPGSPLKYDMFFRQDTKEGVKTGFFSYPTPTGYLAPINGRQFGLWVKPNSTLSGNVTLFDVRSPSSNAGWRYADDPTRKWLPLTGTIDPHEQGNNYYQNRITLQYEDASKQLVLTIANAAVEHLVDHGPASPSENYKFPTSSGSLAPPTPGPYVDPRSLGENQNLSGLLSFGNPIGAKRPLNLVQQRYQLDKVDGLKANMWHQIQVAFVGNDPGHMSIIVDGLVGREVTKMSSIASMEIGDHVTLPSMVLRSPALPGLPGSSEANGANLVLIDSITLDATAIDPITHQVIVGAAALEQILPKRGTIRIDNEFISYDDIQGQTLKNCLRVRRQDSIIGIPGRSDVYPVLEQHNIGALVVPGGIHYNPGKLGKLWAGGGRLKEPLANGGPMPNSEEFNMWAELEQPNTTRGRPVLLATELAIRIKAGVGVINQWPSRGYARLNRSPTNEIIYYDNNGTTPSSLLMNVKRGELGTTASDIIWPEDLTMTQDYTLSLISFEVDEDPTEKFPANPPLIPPPATPPPRPNHYLVQIMNKDDGRVEWLTYTHIDTSKTSQYYFLGSKLYSFYPSKRSRSWRGRERTAFAGTDIPGSLPFVRGSRVLPVQEEIRQGHLLVTGDILTIVPKKPGTGKNGLPYQVCVRYAATDGINTAAGAAAPSDNSWDTVNHYFAFTESLPQEWDKDSFEFLGWPGWGGEDLGKVVNAGSALTFPAYTMPLAAAFTAGYKEGPGEIAIGGDNTAMPFNHERTNPIQPNQPFDGVVDAIYAGIQPGGNSTTDNPKISDNVIVNAKPAPPGPLYGNPPRLNSKDIWLSAGTTINGSQYVTVSNPLFTRQLGLMQIGGEVFAYERQLPSSSEVKLIGRGLLGTGTVDHTGPEPILILPIGPVGRLTKPLQATGPVSLSISSNNGNTNEELNAPALMLCSPDGKNMELFAMPDHQTTPWLRGMYNTKVQGAWPGGSANSSLVIGWWPRYPSGHPIQNHEAWGGGNPQQRNALLRNRMYAWMGFPIRFYDTYFNGGGRLVDLTLLSDGEGTYNVSASALDEGFDWDATLANAMQLTQGTNLIDATSILSRFNQRPVDGVEVRIRFEYRNQPVDPNPNNPLGIANFLKQVAINGNTAPMIGKSYLRARAPTKTLQVEEAR